jgi:hypothetical protein
MIRPSCKEALDLGRRRRCMATMEASRFRVQNGGFEAFRDVLCETQTYVAEYSPAVRLRIRRWHVAEATSGQISVQLLFLDARTRAAVLDRMRRDGARNPLERALRSSHPPAELTQRIWLDSTDPDAPAPVEREIIAFSVFEAVRYHEEEAEAAFIEAERRDRQLGADTELWVVRYGSTSYGRYIRGLSFDSFEELRAFDELSAVAQLTVAPLDHAVNSGVLRRLSWALTTAVDLED